jgi:hypothetical protein
LNFRGTDSTLRTHRRSKGQDSPAASPRAELGQDWSSVATDGSMARLEVDRLPCVTPPPASRSPELVCGSLRRQLLNAFNDRQGSCRAYHLLAHRFGQSVQDGWLTGVASLFCYLIAEGLQGGHLKIGASLGQP